MKEKDKKYVGFWLPIKLQEKLAKKLAQRRKDGEPYTITAFLNSLIRNAVE